MKRYTFRKFFNDLHLWLGLASGLILFIVCLTGTILAFETELVLIFDSKDHYSKENTTPIPFNRIVENIQEQGYIVKEFIFYGESNRNHQFTVFTKEQIANSNVKSARGKSLIINPHTGQEVSANGTLKEFMHSVEQLHRYLLLDQTIGRPIIGVSTIIFVFMCLSGLILWFPKKLKKFNKWGAWKQGFSLKTKANWKRVNYDIHNTFGFYALIPLLLMGLTGLLWSFTWYYQGLEMVLGDKLGKSRFETTINLPEHNYTNNAVIDYKMLIKKADSILPYSNFGTRIMLPSNNTKSVMIRKISSDFLAYNASDKLQFNPYTNELISKTLFKDYNFRAKAAALIRGIHVGNFAGIFTKIIYFLSCLIATTLPITGTFIWLNKIKKK